MGPSETKAEVEFPFKNTTTAEVTITELKAGCGCTEPTVAERVIPPGGSGVVKVAYVPGDREGVQVVHVTVATNEKDGTPAVLRLQVTKEPAVSLSPRLLVWTKGDVAARRVDIRQVTDAPVRLVEVKTAAEDMTVEWAEADSPKGWRLLLTPKPGRGPFTAKVDIRMEVGGRAVNYAVFGMVR